MKSIRSCILLLTTAAILTACSAQTNAPSAEKSAAPRQYGWGDVTGQTITIWGDQTDLSRPYNAREFKRYQELTGNTLNLVSLTKQEYQAKVASGQSALPDVLLGYAGTSIEPLNPNENLYDFTDAPWVADLTDTALNHTIYDGKVIGLPHGEVSVSGMLYNKSIFKRYKLEPPKTQADFMQVCEKLLQNGVAPLYLPYAEISMLLYQLPLDSLLRDHAYLDGLNDGSLSYSDIPEMKLIVEWYKTMADKGYLGKNYEANDWGGMDSAMKSGQYGMMICWDTWLYTDYTGDASAIGLMPAFMGVPDEGLFGGANGLLFMVNKKSSNLDAALDFINYMADPSNYNLAYKGIYTAPVFIEQNGSYSTPQYMEQERMVEKLYAPSVAWPRIKGFSQMDASHIQDYMQGKVTLESCISGMEVSRRARAGMEYINKKSD